MTTQKKETETAKPTPEKKENPHEQELRNALHVMLEPYVPAADVGSAEKTFTTREIITALEQHYNIQQGDSEAFLVSATDIILELKQMGYRYTNTGDLNLEWLMAKRNGNA